MGRVWHVTPWAWALAVVVEEEVEVEAEASEKAARHGVRCGANPKVPSP